MAAVKKGDKVRVDYIGTFDDGTVFDRSKESLEFGVGAGEVIKGFENAVIGMKKGEEKKNPDFCRGRVMSPAGTPGCPTPLLQEGKTEAVQICFP